MKRSHRSDTKHGYSNAYCNLTINLLLIYAATERQLALSFLIKVGLFNRAVNYKVIESNISHRNCTEHVLRKVMKRRQLRREI